MSAYIVSFDHIDMLVAAASQRSPVSGTVGYWHDPEQKRYPGPETRDDRTALGRLLLEENEKSIMYRYPDTVSGGTPIYDRMPGPADYGGVDAYEYPATVLDVLDPVTILKIIHCYEYQSCEHPEWKTSKAKSFCDALAKRQISRLPGYDSAPWGYHYPEGSDPRRDDVPVVISLLDLAR